MQLDGNREFSSTLDRERVEVIKNDMLLKAEKGVRQWMSEREIEIQEIRLEEPKEIKDIIEKTSRYRIGRVLSFIEPVERYRR